jgi:hypothetical protein
MNSAGVNIPPLASALALTEAAAAQGRVWALTRELLSMRPRLEEDIARDGGDAELIPLPAPTLPGLPALLPTDCGRAGELID